MKVIAISGLDGSGKSTQVDRLRRRLEGEGKRVVYFHAVHFSVAEARRRIRGTGPASPAPSERAGVTSAGSGGVLLRKLVLRIDLVRYRAYLRRLRGQGVDVLLSDRFYYDNLVNIAYLQRTGRFARVTPTKPDVAIYLRVDPDAIMARDRPPEQGRDYLVSKRALYDAVAARYSLTVIDGSADADTVERAIAAEVDQA